MTIRFTHQQMYWMWRVDQRRRIRTSGARTGAISLGELAHNKSARNQMTRESGHSKGVEYGGRAHT
jgi:hypothetical protein